MRSFGKTAVAIAISAADEEAAGSVLIAAAEVIVAVQANAVDETSAAISAAYTAVVVVVQEVAVDGESTVN